MLPLKPDEWEASVLKMQKSAEDYLEKILMLREKKGYARSVDIAGELNVTKPSVSFAMKRLRENGYISVDQDGLIELTDIGMGIASRMYERHRTLSEFLKTLGVDSQTAAEDACRLEHDISEKTFEAIRRYISQR